MYDVEHIGETAYSVLQTEARGVVETVFKRCAYLRFDATYVCLALASVGRGPLNIVYSKSVRQLPAGLSRGTKVICAATNQLLNLQSHNSLSTARLVSSVAQYARAEISNSMGPAITGLEQLHAHISPVDRQRLNDLARPSVGLFDIVMGNSQKNAGVVDQSLVRFTAPLLRELSLWLHHTVRTNTTPLAPDNCVCRLLGAGPGLTPSGDDLLAGVLLALRYNGHDCAAEQLGAMLSAAALQQTNPISAGMLREATLGRAGEYAHTVLAMIGTHDGFDSTELSGMLRRMGGSSGWDFLAGVVMVFDAIASRAINIGQTTDRQAIGIQIHG